MRRALRFLVAVALAAPLVEGADLPAIKARGSLRVLAVVVNQADDFFGASPGRGIDRELLEGFASLHKLRLELVQVQSWDALIPSLQRDKGDVIAGRFNVTESRKKQIAFTKESFPSRHVVLTRRPHRIVNTIEEFREEKVGTVKGTSMVEIIAAAGVPAERVDDSIPTGTLPAALKAGKVTAVVLGIENGISARRADPDIQIGMFVGPPSSLAYGVRKTDTSLLAALDEYIDSVRKTPTWSRLVVKYFGDDALEILRRVRGEAAR
jgi:ABC-type amino acid transport substrate-binding protein